MLDEIALHVLDIAQNAIEAQATQICINVREDRSKDRLTLIVSDNGRGLDASEIEKIFRSYYSTKTTRKKRIGLGLALLRQTAEMCDGRFYIFSRKGKGTRVVAIMKYSHIDRPPLGDMVTVIWELVVAHPTIELTYIHTRGRARCTFDTRAFREALEIDREDARILLQHPEVSRTIQRTLSQGEARLSSRSG